jgi:hypothetical protein
LTHDAGPKLQRTTILVDATDNNKRGLEAAYCAAENEEDLCDKQNKKFVPTDEWHRDANLEGEDGQCQQDRDSECERTRAP